MGKAFRELIQSKKGLMAICTVLVAIGGKVGFDISTEEGFLPTKEQSAT